MSLIIKINCMTEEFDYAERAKSARKDAAHWAKLFTRATEAGEKFKSEGLIVKEAYSAMVAEALWEIQSYHFSRSMAFKAAADTGCDVPSTLLYKVTPRPIMKKLAQLTISNPTLYQEVTGTELSEEVIIYLVNLVNEK